MPPGSGWMFDGAGYPAQPDGVPWPTEEWPVAELPETSTPPRSTSPRSDAGSAGGGELLHRRNPRRAGRRAGARALPRRVGSGRRRTSRGRWRSRSPRRCSASSSPRAGSTCSPRRRCPSGPTPPIPATPSRSTTLLHMRSGLEWDEEYAGQSDVIKMLFGAGNTNRAHFAADRPLDVPSRTTVGTTRAARR